jgi:hypothetical protein
MARPSLRRAAIPACTQNPRGEGCPAKPWRSRASFRNPGLGTFFALRASVVRPSSCPRTGNSVIGSHVRSVTRRRSFDGAGSHRGLLPPRKGATRCRRQCSGIGHYNDTKRQRRHKSGGGLQGTFPPDPAAEPGGRLDHFLARFAAFFCLGLFFAGFLVCLRAFWDLAMGLMIGLDRISGARAATPRDSPSGS